MSRIGKKPIAIPSGVKVNINNDVIKVEGPKGSLEHSLSEDLNTVIAKSEIILTRKTEGTKSSMLHGLYRTLIANMVKGVTDGFQRNLEISGVGFRADVQGDTLNLSLGYSHPVQYKLPKGIVATVEKQTGITLKGADKQVLGQTAAEIRALRVPDAYKGKGIKYAEEKIKLKPGKAGKAGGKAA